MALSLLRIGNLRNITQAELHPVSGINLLWGRNGAGKTSVLEAIYLLGRGRSFRGAGSGPLIQTGKESVELFGTLNYPDAGVEQIGLRKLAGRTEIRKDGVGLKKLSLLARSFPLQILTPNSHQILERGPSFRRRYLDWGVFHVEQVFHGVSERYFRALKQRNAALKRTPSMAFVWDQELISAGLEIDRMRKQYLSRLLPLFLDEIKCFLGDRDIMASYRQGWKREASLEEALLERREFDKRRGYTTCGPHHSDLAVQLEGVEAEKRSSRGEQKLIVAALYLAQAQVIREQGGKSPLFLVDDLPAELDESNRKRLLSRLASLESQVFVTGIESNLFGNLPEGKMFHVERGAVYANS